MKETLFFLGLFLWTILCFHWGYKLGVKEGSKSRGSTVQGLDFSKHKSKEITERYFGG